MSSARKCLEACAGSWVTVYLAICIPIIIATTIVMYIRRVKSPLNQKKVTLILLFNIFAICYMLTNSLYYYCDFSCDVPCLINYLNNWVFLLGCVLCWFARAIYLWIRYMVTQERIKSELQVLRSMGIHPAKSNQSDDDPRTKENFPREDPNLFYFNRKQHFVSASNLILAMSIFIFLSAVSILIALASYESGILLKATRSTAERSGGCVPDSADEIQYIILAVLVVIFLTLAYLLRNCDDGFGIKTEMRVACGTIFFATILAAVLDKTEVFPWRPLVGNLVAMAMFIISSGYPVLRTFIATPPEKGIPEEFSSALKLLSFPQGYNSFKAHLASEFSVENILFWTAANDYQQRCHAFRQTGVEAGENAFHIFPRLASKETAEEKIYLWSQRDRLVHATRIYDNFLKPNSCNQVNISFKRLTTVKQILESYEKGEIAEVPADLFANARQEVLDLMSDSFPRYRAAKKWRELVKPRAVSDDPYLINSTVELTVPSR